MCPERINNYVNRGEDHGLTDLCMRESCGLPKPAKVSTAPHARGLAIFRGIDLGLQEDYVSRHGQR